MCNFICQFIENVFQNDQTDIPKQLGSLDLYYKQAFYTTAISLFSCMHSVCLNAWQHGARLRFLESCMVSYMVQMKSLNTRNSHHSINSIPTNNNILRFQKPKLSVCFTHSQIKNIGGSSLDLDLLQVSLSLSYRSTIVYIT